MRKPVINGEPREDVQGKKRWENEEKKKLSSDLFGRFPFSFMCTDEWAGCCSRHWHYASITMLNVSFVLLYSESCLLDLYYESNEDDGVYGRLDSFTSSLMYLTFIHGSPCVYIMILTLTRILFFLLGFFPSCACFAIPTDEMNLWYIYPKKKKKNMGGRRLQRKKIYLLMEAKNDSKNTRIYRLQTYRDYRNIPKLQI